MSKVLGKVTGDLDAPRGPDVEYRISVEKPWFGQSVSVELPRNVNCAHCQGGGCDRCERSGAVSLRDRKAEPERTRVSLPEMPGQGGVCLRIPGQGGPSSDPELGRGHLLLQVSAGNEPTAGVVLLETAPSGGEDDLFRRGVVLAAILLLLFLAMLALAQWP